MMTWLAALFHFTRNDPYIYHVPALFDRVYAYRTQRKKTVGPFKSSVL